MPIIKKKKTLRDKDLNFWIDVLWSNETKCFTIITIIILGGKKGDIENINKVHMTHAHKTVQSVRLHHFKALITITENHPYYILITCAQRETRVSGLSQKCRESWLRKNYFWNQLKLGNDFTDVGLLLELSNELLGRNRRKKKSTCHLTSRSFQLTSWPPNQCQNPGLHSQYQRPNSFLPCIEQIAHIQSW